MHKYQLLRLRADEFHTVLVEYALKDSDVANFLHGWMPLYQSILRREIRLPCYDYKLGAFFTNPYFSPLAERYGAKNESNPLSSASERFEMAFLDRLSSPDYVAEMRANGIEPGLIPDECPPSAEEMPLPTSAVTTPSRAWRTWLHRLVFGNKLP
jgi:hypothetical protein